MLRVSDSRPNNTDKGSAASVRLGIGILEGIGFEPTPGKIKGQTAGRLFEETTHDFLQDAFALLFHLRPGPGNLHLVEQLINFRNTDTSLRSLV